MQFLLRFGIGLTSLLFPSIAFAGFCEKEIAQTLPVGLYYLETCEEGKCPQRADTIEPVKVRSKKLELVYISGQGYSEKRVAIIQLRHEGVATAEQRTSRQKGISVKLSRDRISFICKGAPDVSRLARTGEILEIPADEYDNYHRRLRVRMDRYGEEMHKLFHVPIQMAPRICIRTDSRQLRNFFLFYKRDEVPSNFANLLASLGLHATPSLADYENADALEVQMRIPARGSKSNACFEQRVSMMGSSVNISVTDIGESFLLKVMHPGGIFKEASFQITE